MTPEERQAARARCEAATEGPWSYCFISPLSIANFTAHARTDLPAALDEIERLEGEVERLKKEDARLMRWLRLIEGGDHPCQDEAQLRQWAYEAATLGMDVTDGTLE